MQLAGTPLPQSATRGLLPVASKLALIVATYRAVWFTSTETEISVNWIILILLTETKTEMKKITKYGNERETEKFDVETDRFGYVPVFVSTVLPFHAITQFSVT